jgi:hypothetical protein
LNATLRRKKMSVKKPPSSSPPATPCNSYASDRAEIKALREALADTAKLANELMDRAARIDRKLALAGGGPVPECELGEITRLRSQLLKNISLTDATLSIGGGK